MFETRSKAPRLVRPARGRDLGHGTGTASRTLVDVFAATASRHGPSPAIDAPDGTLTYTQLRDHAAALTERLQALRIGPGDRVGIRVPSASTEPYVAILGVLGAGAAYVPVDHDDPAHRADQAWRRAGVCAVIGDGLEIELLSPAGAPESRAPGPDDEAWVIFTSGSTGVPKGVAVTHRSAAAFVAAERRLWTVEPEDRVLAAFSLGFDASCEEIWLAWGNGAALVPAPRSLVRAGSELEPWLLQRGVTVISTVPTLAAMWSEASLCEVRLLILGGEACPDALGWRLAAGREVWNTYGPTEATVVSTAARIRPGEPVSIGRPLSGWEVAVVDEEGVPVAFGEAGELVIGGVGLGRYLDPELEATRFAPLPSLPWSRAYRAGDIVRETIDGLRFVGRRDDQVKIGGRRLELGEIDAHLNAVPGVRAARAAVRESAAGNRLLVGYVVGDVDPAQAHAHLAQRLPAGLVPIVVPIEELPRSVSGKVDRDRLPWPPPSSERPLSAAGAAPAYGTATESWLAERWAEQLGPLAITAEDDFFVLGGSSLTAAKLVSALRQRYPAVAVSDLYEHRTVRRLAERLDGLGTADTPAPVDLTGGHRRWGAIQVLGVLALLTLTASQMLVGILAYNHWQGNGPQLGWAWLAFAWLLLASAPGRSLLVLIARRGLLGRLTPGRYPRRGWLACRIWFVEALSEACRLETLAGTPWAARYARLLGHQVARDARLGTIPPATSLVSVGPRATLEAELDLHGWWLEGNELVIDELVIEAGARVGNRSLLMPGARIGAGAEIEPASVISGAVPARQRWSGSPAYQVGRAGENWPQTPAPAPVRPALFKALFTAGLGVQALLPLLAALPGLGLLVWLAPSTNSAASTATAMLELSPLLAASFLAFYGLAVAAMVRAVSPLIRAGLHSDGGATAWALWFSEGLAGAARGVLFPLYSSIYTRVWLRLLGVSVGRRTEVSTAVGLNRLTSLDERSFVADDVVFAGARSRDGWIELTPITVGSGTFLGNGAVLGGGTELSHDSLLGVLTTAPRHPPAGTSWFGAPPLELPRVADRPDPARTTDPPGRLVLARGAMDVARILFPASVSVVLGGVVFWALETISARAGIAAAGLSAPVVLFAAGVSAVLITVATKWLVIGRYQPGEHLLWSAFIWRDEIVNSCQEQLAGAWLLGSALGTPLVGIYLRLMGATIGRDVWCQTLAITEFDLVTLGDGAVVNRNACIETHLFHDRLMRIGTAALGAGSTLGPASAVLPDSELGAGCIVGGRSVVMRGEHLPAHTRWHGAPVTAA